MAKPQSSKSKRFSEAWYKEIEPILKREFSGQMLPTPVEIPSSVPSFVITDPEDDRQMCEIREYFETRAKANQQLMEEIVNNQMAVTEKMLKQLCLSDMNKLKIQELEGDLEHVMRSNSDFSVKNIALKHEITNLISRLGANERTACEDSFRLNVERRPKASPFDSNVAALCKRFDENGSPAICSPLGRGQQLNFGCNNNNSAIEISRFNESELESSMVFSGTELEMDSPLTDQKNSPSGSTVIAKYYNGDRRGSPTIIGPQNATKTVTELARTFQNGMSRRSRNNGNAMRVFHNGRYRNFHN